MFSCPSKFVEKVRQTHKDRRRLNFSIAWCETHYKVVLLWRRNDHICTLQHTFDDFCAGNNYIVVVNEDEPIPETISLPENCAVFCLKDGVMKIWENGWSTEAAPSEDSGRGDATPNAVSGQTADAAGGNGPGNDATHREQSDQDYFDDDISAPLQMTIIFDSEELARYGLTTQLSSEEYARKVLEADLTPDHYYVFTNLVDRSIQENKAYRDDDVVENSIARAVVLAKALAIYYKAYETYYRQLVMAIDSPIQKHCYDANTVLSLFESNQADMEQKPILKLMVLLRAMFAPESAYDYPLHSYTRSIFEHFETEFDGLEALKPLYNLFLKISEDSAHGFSVPVLRGFSDTTAEQNMLKQIKSNAFQAIAEPIVKSGLKCMGPMLRNCFGIGSALRDCMEIVSADKRDDREYVEVVFSEYCTISDGKTVISADKIDAFFDEQWKAAITEIHGPRDLKPAQKAKVIENIRKRLGLMERWLQITDSANGGTVRSGKLMALRRDILLKIEELLLVAAHRFTPYDAAIVQVSLKRIREKLNGQLLDQTDEFVDFLRTGVFCLDDNYLPFVDDLFSSYQYYEPWRNALRHIATPVVGLRKVLEEISNPDNVSLYDNIGQAVAICGYLNEECGENINANQYIEDLDPVRRAAQDAVKKYRSELELAFAYGRISETEKEDISENLFKIFS